MSRLNRNFVDAGELTFLMVFKAVSSRGDSPATGTAAVIATLPARIRFQTFWRPHIVFRVNPVLSQLDDNRLGTGGQFWPIARPFQHRNVGSIPVTRNSTAPLISPRPTIDYNSATAGAIRVPQIETGQD
jgi:hypothetical protein